MRKFLPVLIISASLLISFGIVRAQTGTSTPAGAGTSGISFPVPELGNCTSKEACKTYCNDPANMQACIAFAKAHGLMNKDEAQKADDFRKTLQSQGGPGGCKSPEECKAFCGDVANMDVCVKFAQAHGVKDAKTDQGSKIATYIKSGGQMPGGCTSEGSCKQYCSDFSHAKECYDFAVKVGIAQANGNATSTNAGPSQAQLQKLSELAAQGQTPGQCNNKDDCESYCKDASHRSECIAFAQKMGLVSQDQAQKIQANGGKGPGGCDSREACQAYCAEDAHHDECFKFAQDNGILNKDQVNTAQQGLLQLRAGLSQAPDAVKSCIDSTVGTSTIADIESGQITPGSDTGASVKSCFEKFGQKSDPSQLFKNAPAPIAQCLKDKLGSTLDQIKSGNVVPTAQIADTVRACSQQVQFNMPGNATGLGHGMPNPTDFLSHLPPGVMDCVKTNLGDDFEKLSSGATSQITPDEKGKIQSCFQSFKPQTMMPLPTTGASSSLGPLPPQQSGDPAQKCAQYGGTWTGTNCIPPKPPVPTLPTGPYPTSSGYATSSTGQNTPVPPPTTVQPPPPTNDPATACAQYGGIWNGTTCVRSY